MHADNAISATTVKTLIPGRPRERFIRSLSRVDEVGELTRGTQTSINQQGLAQFSGITLVGIDLAWGTRARTGLALLDGAGHLLDLADAQTDNDIATWMDAHVPGRCLVAIDAPIIVTNPTGSRECDRLVTRHFGRHHAGTHAVNATNPIFAGGSTINPPDSSHSPTS